jgi:hypothetical protein
MARRHTSSCWIVWNERGAAQVAEPPPVALVRAEHLLQRARLSLDAARVGLAAVRDADVVQLGLQQVV